MQRAVKDGARGNPSRGPRGTRSPAPQVSADRLLIQAGCAAQTIYQNTPRLVTKAGIMPTPVTARSTTRAGPTAGAEESDGRVAQVGASHRIPALDMAHAAGVLLRSQQAGPSSDPFAAPRPGMADLPGWMRPISPPILQPTGTCRKRYWGAGNGGPVSTAKASGFLNSSGVRGDDGPATPPNAGFSTPHRR
jgi:hypothetical protein